MKICHLADIQIRLYSRIEEFKCVFNNLYKSLEEKKPDRIVITGDLFHNKGTLSGESIDLMEDFLTELTNYAPLDIIIGNHDISLTYSRMDSLSPIIKVLNKTNLKNKITFFSKSGIYDIDEKYRYVVYEFRDKQYPEYKKEEGKIAIGLYHGAPYDMIDENGYKLKSEINSELFNDLDFLFAGDIHKREFFKPTFAMVGSLVMQSHKEESYPHGYILWDIDNKTYEEIEIESDYGFVTLTDSDFEIIDDKTCKLIRKIKFKELNLRCRLDKKYTNEQILSIRKEIKTKLHKDITIQQFIDTPQSIKEFSKLDLSNIKVQNNLIEEYCKLNKISNIDEILKFNEEINKKIRTRDFIYNIKWQPLFLKWKNMFNFGDSETNSIDFTKLENIIAIIGKNGNGKSSISKILLFAIYNQAPGVDKIEEVINNRKDDAYVQVIIKIESEIYRITKELTRKKKTVSTSISFEKYNKLTKKFETDNEKVGDDKKDIKRNIETILGNYNDIVSQTFSVNGDEDSPLKKSETVLRDYVNKFIGLNIFELLYKGSSKDESEQETIIKQYDKISFEEKLENFDLQIIDNNTNITTLNNLLVEKDNKIIEIDNNINNETIKLNAIIDKKTKVSELTLIKSKVNELKSDIATTDLLINTLKNNYNNEIDKVNKLKIIDINAETLKLDSEKNNIENQINEYNKLNLVDVEKKKELDDKLIKNKEIKGKIDQLNIKLKELEININNYKRQTEILNRQSWMNTADNCKICELAKDAFIAKEKLKTNSDTDDKAKELLNKYTSSYNANIDSDLRVINEKINKSNREVVLFGNNKSKIVDKINTIRKIESDIKLIEKNIEGIQNNITLNIEKKNLLYNSLKEYTEKLTELEKYDKDIKQINEMEGNIKSFNQYKIDVKNEIIKLRKQLDECNSKIGYLNSQIENTKNEEKKYNEALNKLMVVKSYRELVNRNGLPISILDKYIPIINEKIKFYLDDSMLNFDIYFKIDDNKLRIIINKYNAECQIKLASGKETNFSSWVIRATLSEISILPSSNIFLIDEGFGAFDSESSSNIGIFFNKLRQKFDKIIIISHLPVVLDIADNFIDVAPDEEGFSQIMKN